MVRSSAGASSRSAGASLALLRRRGVAAKDVPLDQACARWASRAAASPFAPARRSDDAPRPPALSGLFARRSPLFRLPNNSRDSF